MNMLGEFVDGLLETTLRVPHKQTSVMLGAHRHQVAIRGLAEHELRYAEL